MFCPKCGTQQPNQTRVCHKCNAPMPTGRIENKPTDDLATVIAPLPNQTPYQQPYQSPDPAVNQPFNQQYNQQQYNQQYQQPADQPANQPQPARPVLTPPPPPAWDMPVSNAVNPQASQPYEQPDRPKYSYPLGPTGQNDYNPGQYLGDYAPGYVPGQYLNEQPAWTASNNVTSNRAIASLVCGLLSFLFCPVITAVIAVVLGQMELSAIKQGTAAPAGKPIAQIGFYTGIANLVIFVGFFFFVFLLAFIGAVS